MSRRWFMSGAVLVAVAAPLLAPSPALAAPAKPDTITIDGAELAKAITVHAKSSPELFEAVLSQVNWLASTKGQTSSPKAENLGPKFTVVVHVGEQAKQTYDLYPLAAGGPRAYRPAKQPDKRKTTNAWFYGRLNMSETLRAAGVPLPEKPETLHGGIGGGERVFDENTLNPGRDLDKLLADLREVLLLNGAVVVVITLGLAGISLLVRRRTR
ncbi:hypothetical protein RB614_01345 [Phytohabitans sp. ZYX-F-186]|uniref:Secreted protein n=1 Tax=Phytohabitans maris TaxID=3071409 RepID=A0ABU0Z7Y8_9ACTN|nr:hypothetical protein [Phytohabitans sp. ZYX-F-186]MDQ7903164.1 hypothetical protein [Phytohabitans sp. ZYX-F-186]